MKVPLKLVAKNRQDVDSLRHGLEMKGYSTIPRQLVVEEPQMDDLSMSIEQSIHEFFLMKPDTLSQCR